MIHREYTIHTRLSYATEEEKKYGTHQSPVLSPPPSGPLLQLHQDREKRLHDCTVPHPRTQRVPLFLGWDCWLGLGKSLESTLQQSSFPCSLLLLDKGRNRKKGRKKEKICASFPYILTVYPFSQLGPLSALSKYRDCTLPDWSSQESSIRIGRHPK